MSTGSRWSFAALVPLAHLLIAGAPARAQTDAGPDAAVIDASAADAARDGAAAEAGARDALAVDSIVLPDIDVPDDGDCSYGGGAPGRPSALGSVLGAGLLVALVRRRRA